jgi:hypothetical protein
MSWKNRPSNFAIRILNEGDKVVKKIATDMLQQVIVGSPVDTGAFRGNHHITLGAPDKAFDTTVTDKGGSKTQQEGNQKILQSNIGGLIYIQNNLPYALALENGHSEQRAHGIYSLAFMNVTSKYK